MANDVLMGFESLESLMAKRIVEVDTAIIRDAIIKALQMHTLSFNTFLNEFVEISTKKSENIGIGVTGQTLQPLDQYSKPKPMNEGGSYAQGWPLFEAGTAYGMNFQTSVKMTVQELQEKIGNAIAADQNWNKRRILASWLYSQSFTFDDTKNGGGSLTVRPLANGDAITYPGLEDDYATDNHYLAQADAIDDFHNPFTTIEAELDEHSSNNVSEGSPVIVLTSRSLSASIKALTLFREPREMFVSQPVTATVLQDSAANIGNIGKFIGTCGDCIIREWNSIPSGYMLAYAPSAGKFLRMRQPEEPELQGFYALQEQQPGHITSYQFFRHAGYAPMNRIAALAYYVGNASYQDPARYSAPLGA